MKNIAVFGGSFNPATLAHSQVVEEVIKETDITKIILSPSGDRLDKDHGIEYHHRNNLNNIFYKILKESGINVELDNHFFEGKNGGNTTTIQEEAYFKKKLGFSPYFVYGSDVVSQMPNWSGNKNSFIEEKLKKIFITRPGYKFKPEKYAMKNFILLDIPHIFDISSSMAKQMIQEKLNVSKILHHEIVEYIKKNNLYSN